MSRLDDAYANSIHIPGGDAYPERWSAQARAFVAALGQQARTGISYGASDRQRYDLMMPGGPARGLCIFVHGGYWIGSGRTDWSHLARGPLAQHWAVAMPGYDLAPAVAISDITTQIARAVQAIAAEVPGPVTLAGHSAGAHLAARMLAPGMLPSSLAARLRHVALISPLSDLRPLLETSMNRQFGMDLAAAEAESPVLQPAPDLPVSIWVGGDERPAFLDQAQWLSQAWGCEKIVVPGKHHFDVIEALEDPESPIVARLTGQASPVTSIGS